MQKPSRLLPDDSHHLMDTDCVLPQVALWGKGMVCALKRTSGLNGWISNQKHISLQSVALREGSCGFEVNTSNSVFTCIFPKVFCSSRPQHSSRCIFRRKYKKKVPFIRHHERYFFVSQCNKPITVSSPCLSFAVVWDGVCSALACRIVP